MGYHLKEIKKGELGEVSKVIEELEEALDALDQDCTIMFILELADAYGALDRLDEKYNIDSQEWHCYLFEDAILRGSESRDTEDIIKFVINKLKDEKESVDNKYNFTMKLLEMLAGSKGLLVDDLLTMSRITERAFKDGTRK